jgi:hypothetical protein
VPPEPLTLTANGVSTSVTLDTAGLASFTTAVLSAGSFSVTADYSGDGIPAEHRFGAPDGEQDEHHYQCGAA